MSMNALSARVLSLSTMQRYLSRPAYQKLLESKMKTVEKKKENPVMSSLQFLLV